MIEKNAKKVREKWNHVRGKCVCNHVATLYIYYNTFAYLSNKYIYIYIFFLQPPSGLSVLQLEKNLRTMVDRLNLEKHERIKNLKRFREEDQHLCDILCTTPYYIPSGSVPSEDQLQELKQHVEGLKKEKVCKRNFISYYKWKFYK